ncbi:speckle targeted PIP5K1A-regulated poly(A) polymerase-like [Saccostrea echinata]|uniref:speckle targeted PIP5K1A-regulated poly(A) polymerase-like n=1 Tax=Saccostrea echinata TaxID=191078 RepID=UPI002A8230EB|nr:speckle targeted PIP5K1A-regulated poly(A) polymerase-like [Saccostrea echinata]
MAALIGKVRQTTWLLPHVLKGSLQCLPRVNKNMGMDLYHRNTTVTSRTITLTVRDQSSSKVKTPDSKKIAGKSYSKKKKKKSSSANNKETQSTVTSKKHTNDMESKSITDDLKATKKYSTESQNSSLSNTEPHTLKVWVLDGQGRWVRRSVQSSSFDEASTNIGKDFLTNRKQIWSIPDVYRSKEVQTFISEARCSVLIHCYPDTCYHLIAICERLGTVSRAVIVNRKTVLVTYEDENDVTRMTTEVNNDSGTFNMMQLEKRVFKVTQKTLRKATNQEPKCQNVNVLSQTNLYDKIKNKKLGDQMRVLGDRGGTISDRQRVWFFITQCIQDIVDITHPDHQVLPFGSIVNGFATENSDLDIVVMKEGYNKKDDGIKLLMKIQTALKRLHSYKNIAPILNARIPIIKFQHPVTGVHGDISYGNNTGITASIYLNAISRFSPSVVPFILTVKLWATHYMGWFPQKFVFTALALFYLQQCKVIPPIGGLQIELEPSLGSRKWECDVEVSPEDLLYGYFKFYEQFDFHHNEICLETGTIIPKRGYFDNKIVNPFTNGEISSYEDIICRLNEDSISGIQSSVKESLRILTNLPDSFILGNRRNL